MAGTWGDSDKPVKTASNQEQAWGEGDSAVPASALRKVGDLGLSVAKGVVAVPEALVGLADIPTGGRVGKFLENEGGAFGFRPKQAKEYLGGLQSDDLRDKQQQFQKADGIIDKAGVALSNPSLITNAVAESVPLMGAGVAPARAALAVAPKLGAVAAGAIGEGVVGAGSAAEGIRQETADGLMTAEQSGLALATGAATSAFGFAGGKMAQRLGIGDVDTMLTQGAIKTAGVPSAKSIPRQVVEGAIAEGWLEELPQSVSEQVLQNLALDKPWHEGVDDAAVMGTLAGMAMGGAAAGVSGFAQDTPPADAQQPPAAPPAPQPQAGPTLALPAPDQGVIAVGGDGTARTPAYQKPSFAGEYADVTDVVPRALDTQPADPVRTAVESAANSGGALSVAALVAIDSGVTPRQEGAFEDVPELDAQPPQVNLDEIADPYDRAYYESLFDDETAPLGAQPVLSAFLQDDDNIPDFDAANNVSEEDFLRALGADELEIQDAIATTPDRAESAPEGAALPAGPQADVTAGTPEGAGAGAAQPAGPVTDAPTNLRDALARVRAQKQEAANAQAAQAPAPAAAPAPGPTGAPAVEANGVAPQASIQAITAKQIPDMTDAELQAAIVHYGPAHKRTAKLQKEAQRRAALPQSPQSQPNGATNVPQADQTQQAAAQPAQAGPAQPAQGLIDGAPAENHGAQGTPAPGAQGAATSEPEFTTLKTTYGDSVTVRTADLNSDKPRLRQYTKDGKSKAVPAIARDNLDPTGGKRAEQAKANADNPLFQVVTTRNGAAFGSAAAAQREVNRLGFSESHEVVPVDGGFVGRKKQAQALDGKAQVAINSEASTEAVAASDGAAPALRRTQPGEAAYTLLDARNDLIELRTREANQGRVGDDRLGQQISRQEKLIAEMEAQASTQDVQEPPSWESANPKQRQEILDSAMTKLAADDAKAREAAPTNPAAKKPSAAQTRAKADLMNALADLGDILGKNTRMNIMPEQEQKLLPVLTRVLDAAFRLGYAKFKDSAKFALDQIRTHLGDEAADALTLDHLQGAYIAMAGGKQGTDTKRAVIDVETKAEIEQHEAAVVAEHAEADNEGNAQSADAPTKELNNADTEPSGHPADQGRAPEVSGRRGVGDDAAARADSGNVEAGQPTDVPAPADAGRAGSDGVRVPAADVGGKRPTGKGGHAANGRTGASGARAPDAGTGGGSRGLQRLTAGAAGSGQGTNAAKQSGTAAARAAVKDPKEVSPANPGPGNFHIDSPLEIVGGGQVARFDKNQAAIDLLNTIREDSRQATAEEQRVLAGYTGWGSFGQELFQGTWEKPMPKDGWQARDKWLREHLGEDEWKSAQRSITNAHYTDPPTVMAMWNMVKRMGFTGGRVLEPSMGIGNFFGMMPADLMARSQLSGIELDSLTGAMAKLLYPDANVKIMGYQESKTPDDFHDVVIGNWPFENTTIADRRYNSLSPFLHDYFFLKAVDQVRPGGLVIGITSNGTMDKKATRIRAALAKKAELVSAIRLPSGAFQEYAGTKVVTDIVILRKREQPLSMVPPDPWINSVSYKTPAGPEVFINEYYVANPGNVIGTTDFGHGTTRMQPGMIVHRPENMAERLRAAVELVPEGAYKKAERTKHITYITNHTADREGALTEQDGQLMVVRGEHLAPAEQVRPYKLKSAAATAQREKELRALIDMRGKYASLIEADRGGADATAQRTALREAYEAFTAEHGPLGDSFGLNYLKRIDDPFRPALAALDVNGRPSAILTGSTMRGAARMENPTAQDAYVLARNSAVEPTIDEIAALAKKPADEVKAALLQSGAIFETPAGAIVPSDIYLSGNVREKLRQAQAGLEEGNAAMQRNVDELSKVVPKDIPYFNIESQLGATWVPPKTYAAYVAHMLNMPDSDAIGVTFINGRWKVRIPDGANRRAEASTGFGTGHYPFSKLVNAAMSNQTVKIRRKDSDGVEHLDTEATDEANGKISDIRGKFGEWLWSDPERRVAQEREYNEVRNAYATPKYDGSFLAFEGMALSLGRGPFNLREHQVNAIWRALVNRRSINGHEVGTGKTFTMGGIAVESRRYGIAKKPVLLAHNANSASVAAEIQQMYPGAKVLYIDNLTPDTIAVKMRQIANDDWDTIVMPHSLIDRLSFREETLMAMAQDDIRSLEEEAYAAADDDGVTITAKMLENDDELKKLRSVTAKELVKARNRIIESIKDQAMRSSKEGAIPFEELGIDMVLVDEVHEFKKPPISTRMNMKGLNTQTSNRSIALQFITRYIRANNNGGNVHTFTGTPITNTLTEIFHQMRYVMEDEMKAAGVETWDGWFGSFAKEVQDVELSAAGEYEAVTRLAGFINVPELRRMIGQYMDVVFAEDMPEMQPRRVNGKTMASADLTEAERAELLNGRTEGATDRPYKKVVNVTSDLTAEQKTIFAQLQSYARSWRSMTGKQRKDAMAAGSPESPIITEGMANKASFDVRLTRDSEFAGQEGTAPDDPGSKASKVVANVLEIYRSSPDAAQVIFAEQGYSTSQKRSAGRDAAGNKQYRTVKTFSTMRDIVARLVDQGIPAEQIAMVDGSTSKEKRKEIADAMNALRIRVVIGSTDTLGVGVNMQRNLRAMHHMDAPYMPGELEQRNGRGLRQGNQWNTVMEYRYMTDRLDGRRWQILAIKQRFITAFLKSNSATRVIEGDAAADEDSDILQSFSEAAGDPRILIREKLSKNVEALKRSERLHGNGVADAIQGIRRQNDSIAWAKKRLTEMMANNLPGKVRDLLQAQGTNYRATVGKTVYDSRAEAEEAMQQHLQDNIRMEASNVFVGTYAGEPVMAGWPSLQSAPHLTITLGNQEFVSGSLRGLESQLRGLPARIEKVQQEINTKSGSIGRLEEVAAAPFARAADLERAKKQFDALVADIAANPVPPPAWLRAGASVESAAFRNGKEFLVTGHRWNAEGWFVLAQDAKGEVAIPFAEVTDAQGMPVYEPREFEAPEVHTKEAKAPKVDAAAAPADDGTKFSRTPATKAAYQARIDALYAGGKPLPHGVRVLDRSDMLGLLGMGSGPVHLVESKVEQGRFNHGLSADDWKKIPGWLDDPAMVFDSETQPGRLVFIAPEMVNGSPVRMIVDPRPDGQGVNLLVNAYDADRNPFQRWERDGLMRYFDQQKAPSVTGSFQPRLTGLPGDRGRNKILTEKHLGGYRRANTPAAFMGQPTSPADSNSRNVATQLLVDGLKAKWTRAPEIIVARNMQDAQIPQAVRDYDATLKSQGASGEARGFIYKGKVYLLSDQLMGPQQIAEVLFHEVLGHYGLRGVFGKGLDSILQQMGTMRRADVVAKAREYGLFDSDALGIDPEQASSRQIWEAMSAGQRLEAAEEVLAEMAQTQPNIGFVQRAIAAIRNWLRAHVPGFERMRLTDADIVQAYILPARGYVTRSNETAQQAIDRAERQSFAPAFSLDDDAGAKALAEFAKSDELFALPKSDKDTVEGIVADNDPRIKIGKPVSVAGRVEYMLTMPNGDKATLSVRDPNPYGGVQAYDMVYTDEGPEVVVGRPGENPDDVEPTGDVWINVADFKHGEGFGTVVYNIAATYAHNTGRIFIGDPHGLSKDALRRRLEQMLSSALKFGTTAHLAPHPDQMRGGHGVPPLRWVYGDDVGNVERMIAASVKALDNGFPQSKLIEYRSDGNFYNTQNGRQLPRGVLAAGLRKSVADRRANPGGDGSTGQAGWRTIARAALFRHLQSKAAIGSTGIPERGSVLAGASAARAGLQSDGSAGPIGSREERATRILYSRTAGAGSVSEGGASRTQGQTQMGNAGDLDPDTADIRFSRAAVSGMASKARDELSRTFGAPGKLSWWHKTVGTMYNLAERSPVFKRVFDSAQGFVDDVSHYATDAAELAPKLLPKLETWRDIAKRPISAADNAAVAKPVFEGTLDWARDEAGKPVRLQVLLDAAEKLTPEQKAQRLLRQNKISEGMLKAWQSLPLEQYEKLVASRYESQMLKAGIVWTPAELKAQFKLTDAQVELYQEFRAATDRSLDTMARSDMLRFGGEDVKDLADMVMDAANAQDAAQILRDHLLMLAKENPDRAGAIGQLANGMLERAARVQELQEQGYAPLSRFGKYTVDVVDAGGERQYFGLFETAREANIMAMKMRKGFGQDAVTQGTLSDEEFKLLAGITPESLELFGNMLGLDATGDDAQDQAFQEYLRRTKTNRSAMRRLIHRQGIAGYSEDVGRVLASFIYSNARQTSAGLHMGDLGEAITVIPKQQGELKDAAIQLSEYVKNPQEEAQMVRGLLFAQYLGGSIASAVVNMTQPVAVSFPWLSQFGGAKQAATELGRAAKNLASRGHRYEADLAAALKLAEEEGTVSPQEVHQLMAQARGSGSLRPGDGTRAGDARAAAGNALTRLSLGWGKVFGAAEQVNRRMTFIAAYRVAKAQGMANPAAFAKKAVVETQFVYSKANKMKWGRGAVGATVMTFKTYSIAYIELLHRMYTQGGPEGKQAVLLALAVLMLMGGAGGLPFAEDAEDLVDGLAQMMGYNFNSKKAKQELLESVFGEAGAGFVERGITGLPGMPLDVSGRLGMGNLLPGTGIFKEKTDHTRDVLELVGPVGDLAKRVASGGRSILTGDVGAGLLQVSPVAVRNAAKGADMAARGMYRDDKGYKVIDTTPTEAVMKAIGFQPASVAKVQEANFINQQAKNYYSMQAQEIRALWARGIFEQNPDLVADARAQVEDWNRKNPDQRMVIAMPAVFKRVREMSKTKDQRIADTAPKAMRQALREESARARAAQ